MLDFVQLEFFVYGFIGVIWTHSLWFPLALNTILWFGMVWTAIHREDPDDEQFEFHVYSLLEILFGVWTGFWFLWALRTPMLWDVRIMRRDKAGKLQFTFVTTLIIVGALLAALGVYYVTLKFEGVSNNVALGVGSTLIVVGSILIIAMLIYAWVTKNDDGDGRLTVKYLLYLALLISTPAVYDYLVIAGFDRFHGLILLAVLIAIYVTAYFYIIYAKPPDSKDYFDDDKKKVDKKEVIIFLVFSGIIHFFTMLAGWLVDINTGSRVVPIVITIGTLTAFWTILLILIALIFFPERRESSRQSNRVGMKTNKYQNKSKSKSKKNQKKIYTDLF